MSAESDPNQNETLLAMTGFQNSAIRNIRDMDSNTRMTRSKPKFTWICVKEEFMKWQTLVNVFIFVATIILITFMEYGVIPSTKVGFICGDPLISHKFNGEIITPEILGVLVSIIPLSILVISQLTKTKNVKEMDFFLIAFFLKEATVGCLLTLFLTEVAKSIIAEHRPHFFDVCEPDTAKNCINGTWVEDFTCTSTIYSYYGYFLTDSSRSFPSGHSSISAFIGVYSVYLVHANLTTSQIGELMKPFLVAICLTFTIVCSLTRISDRRHHWWDVLTGDLLGLSIALYYIYISHRKYKKIFESTKISSADLERNNCVI